MSSTASWRSLPAGNGAVVHQPRALAPNFVRQLLIRHAQPPAGEGGLPTQCPHHLLLFSGAKGKHLGDVCASARPTSCCNPATACEAAGQACRDRSVPRLQRLRGTVHHSCVPSPLVRVRHCVGGQLVPRCVRCLRDAALPCLPASVAAGSEPGGPGGGKRRRLNAAERAGRAGGGGRPASGARTGTGGG